jgi:hypothetical protein
MPTMAAPGGPRRVPWRGPMLTLAVVASVVLLYQQRWTAPRTEATDVPRFSPPTRQVRAAPEVTPKGWLPRTASPTHLATATLRRMVRRHTPGSVSAAAYDVDSGRQVRAGATNGMLTASLVKVEFLETLLLRHQRSHTPLSADERADATAMIENSDNGAADAIYWDDDADVGLLAAERALGLSPDRTKPRGDDFWGLSTTSAPEQIMLLKNLVQPSSPLTPAHRRFALHLMENVEADQCWGVPVVADEGSTYAVKNGWLAIDDDGDRWAVSSDGVVQVDGHQVLISVMTEHDESMEDGVQLVQRLARAAAAAVVAAGQGSVR